jgi:hypothetical protein
MKAFQRKHSKKFLARLFHEHFNRERALRRERKRQEVNEIPIRMKRRIKSPILRLLLVWEAESHSSML